VRAAPASTVAAADRILGLDPGRAAGGDRGRDPDLLAGLLAGPALRGGERDERAARRGDQGAARVEHLDGLDLPVERGQRHVDAASRRRTGRPP